MAFVKNNILEVSNLNVIYGQNRGWLLAGGQDTFHAVKDVSFSASKGDTLCIVSGSATISPTFILGLSDEKGS